MIKVNGTEVKVGNFPDNSLYVSLEVVCDKAMLEWKYESDEELFILICVTKHLRRINKNVKLELFTVYYPHARMDRVKNNSDCFTLKYFTEIINYLNFERVYVLDPHSDISVALIDRVEVIRPLEYINKALREISEIDDETVVCFPDEGSMKRYKDLIKIPYVFCIKERDWKTGEIKNTLLVGDTNIINNRNVLIIDDICSKGTTFLFTEKELRKYNPKNVYLYVTHCENTIFKGKLLEEKIFEKIFTTDSIFKAENNMIEVFKI